MSFSIQVHVFIVVGLTFILGSIVKKLIKNPSNNKLAENFFPYALVYVPLALVYAFTVNEMPLTGFSIDPIYVNNDSSNLGPQSISGESIIAATIVIASIVVNSIVWLYSLYVVIRRYVKNRQNQTST